MLPMMFSENLFDDLFNDAFGRTMWNTDKALYGKNAARIMKTDVHETEDSYELAVDLPGFKKDEIGIELKDGYLTITASKGTKWMNMLSNIAVPIVLIFGFISIIRAFNDVGGVAGINALVKEDSITFAKAVALGVGSYVVGSVMFTPDIMRFAKNAKTSIIVMIITIMVGNSFMVFFGAIGSVVYGDPDIMGVLALQGLLAPAFIVMVLNIWSTAQGCVYSGSMSLSSVIKVPRNKLTLVFGLVGTILGCVGFYNLFGSYINFLSSTVPPIVGIVFADFLTKYNHGYTDLDSLPRADIGGFVSWIVGVAVTFIPVLLPSINCVVVAFLVKVIFNKVGKKQ